jgi:GTP-binding protein
MKSIVAIVGRPNVGKSTLFNRIVGERRAIVDDMPGVTRDRNYAVVERFERPFILVDTGGFEPVTEDRMLQQMREQSLLAMEEADLILFMMDAKQGLTPADLEVASMLRRVDKPVLYLVNKVDGERIENEASEFYALGIDELITISAAHNRGVRDLLDQIQEHLSTTNCRRAGKNVRQSITHLFLQAIAEPPRGWRLAPRQPVGRPECALYSHGKRMQRGPPLFPVAPVAQNR